MSPLESYTTPEPTPLSVSIATIEGSTWAARFRSRSWNWFRAPEPDGLLPVAGLGAGAGEAAIPGCAACEGWLLPRVACCVSAGVASRTGLLQAVAKRAKPMLPASAASRRFRTTPAKVGAVGEELMKGSGRALAPEGVEIIGFRLGPEPLNQL